MASIDKAFVSGTYSEDEENEGVEPERDPDDLLGREVLKAAEKGEIDKLNQLLDSNPELVNIQDKEGYTPLHRACYENRVETVKILLQRGANIAAKTDLQWEPLHSCCRWSNVDCAAVLLAEGANINAASEGGQTPLHIAASYGTCYNMIQLLLNHPYIDSSLKNNCDETAFDIARRSSKFRNVFDMADPLLDTKNIDLL